MECPARGEEASATGVSKATLAETPAARNSARNCPSAPATAGLSSANHENNKGCLSPPRPRQQRASCKPSPARSAAAVILATLLGGQGQPSDAPQEEGEENAGVEGIGGTSDAKAAVDASSENAAAAEQHDGGRSVGVQPWSPRLNEAGRRARFLEGDWHRESRDDPEWGLSEPPGEGSRGEGSRRRPQEQSVPNGVASPGGGLLGGSSGREGRSGTPASAGVVRRSPRQRSPRMRAATSANRREGQGQQEGKRSAVKGEKGLAVSWTRPLDAGGSCEGGVKGGEDRKMKKEESGGFGGVGGGGVLFAPEGLGPGSGSGDDYGGYSRKDKSLGLLCGRFVEVYGRSQHFRDKVSGEGGGANSSGDGPEGMVELDRAAGELGVARRRIYDVINILESVCVVTRARKNTYRWHGKSNLVLTLRQLQRTAALIFPGEVIKNGMSKCLQRAKLPGFDNAVGSLGGPRADGHKEKSLGGLCRRFVQLFLVGNDVVSVAEAAEKLSDPEDVADGNVVYKTRARRLYDIANALAALGLVEKVRSRDSYKPNFRWIGMPVRKLPLLDPAEAKQAGLDIAAVDGHLHARSSSSGVSQGSPDAPGRTTSAGAGAIAVAGAAVAASGASKSGAKNIATVRLGADGADGGRTRAATDLVANHGEARPLVTAGAPVTGSQARRRGTRRDARRPWEGNDTSPCTQPARRFVSAVVTPNTAGSTAAGVHAWASSECMSDQESPVDPRKVMREFPEPESCGASGDGSSNSSSRKRSRTANRCDSWLTEETPDESGLQRLPSPSSLAPFSFPHLAAAAISAATAMAGKTRGASTAAGGTLAHLPRPKRAAAAGRSVSVLGRKRRASCAVVPSPDTRARAARVSESPRMVDAGADVRSVLGQEQMASVSDGSRPVGAWSVDYEDRVVGRHGGSGDWLVSGDEVVDGGAVGDAVAVTPRGRSLSPLDPDTMRARLDDYMKIYTEKYQIWREGGNPDFPAPPPPLGQPKPRPPPPVEHLTPAPSVRASAESSGSPAMLATGRLGRRTRHSLASSLNPVGTGAKTPRVLMGGAPPGKRAVVRDGGWRLGGGGLQGVLGLTREG